MPPIFCRLALALVLLPCVCFGQDTTLNVKSSYDVGEPIEISVTAPAGTKVEWAFSPGLTTKPASTDGLKHWGWAKPGKHTVTATIAAIVKTKKITVFVPDPSFPNDVTKAKLSTLEIFETYIPATLLADEFIQKGGTEPDPSDPPQTPPPDSPPPAPPQPPPPKVAKQVILLYEEASRPTAASDPAVATWLHTNVPGSWYSWDDDYVAGSFAKYPPAVADLYLFGKNSRPDNEPTVVVEFKDGQRKSYVMPADPAALLRLLEGFGPTLKADAATFIYEKDLHVVPAPVLAAFNKLNRAGIRANPFEDDTTDGTGETPDQYKVPLAAAKEAEFPATAVLVVTAGATVLRVVKGPKTEQEVLEAVKP